MVELGHVALKLGAAAGAFDFGRPRRQPGGGDVVFRLGRQPRRVELDCVERRQHVAGGNEGELLDMKLANLAVDGERQAFLDDGRDAAGQAETRGDVAASDDIGRLGRGRGGGDGRRLVGGRVAAEPITCRVTRGQGDQRQKEQQEDVSRCHNRMSAAVGSAPNSRAELCHTSLADAHISTSGGWRLPHSLRIALYVSIALDGGADTARNDLRQQL